ncbi:MAG: hypothetical protein JXB49_14260 [Bacteroidales bacterium]|nr:hypothetical protein [Bacteroidales bacterium]
MLKTTTIYQQLINQKFGFLIVRDIIRDDKSTKKHPWRAICECTNCGNKNFNTSPIAIIKGRTTSCGCRRDQYDKTRGKNSVLYKGYEEINGKYWGTIKNRAKKRGYSINVSMEYAWKLYLQQNRKCALSGLPIIFATSNKKSSETTASLDRIDSKVGYVEGNVQWVHKDVNIMKNVFNQKHFILLCKLIAKNNPNEN